VAVDYFQHVKPGKGGAFVRTTLKGVQNGKTVDRTFRAGEDLEQAILEKRPLQYLYREGDSYVFMDTEHFEQTYGGAGRARRRGEVDQGGRHDRPRLPRR
jgi:elongation factor P